jgi:uncharacterized YigZ family protein
LAFAYPFRDLSALDDIRNNLKKKHPQACHLCFAYRLGVNVIQWRASDDGEPSNSAGTPILGQLLAMNLTNTLVVVVRYFGGTKLGVGGLISAYKAAAREALNNACVVAKTPSSLISFFVTFDKLPFVMHHIKKQGIQLRIKENLNDGQMLVLTIEKHKLLIVQTILMTHDIANWEVNTDIN